MTPNILNCETLTPAGAYKALYTLASYYRGLSVTRHNHGDDEGAETYRALSHELRRLSENAASAL